MPASAEPSVLYLVINLPSSADRKMSMLEQGEKFGLDLRIVEAVAGKTLSQEQLDLYDAKGRRRYYNFDLTNNEIACVLSHRKCLEIFLKSGAEHLVILEDDAELAPHFNEGVRELTQHLCGWEVAKLYTDDGRLFPLMPPCPEAAVQPVFPKKVLWMSIGYMYTRAGAEKMYEAMQSFFLPADLLIANALLFRNIPTIGVAPGIVRIHELGMQSDIDAQESRKRIPANKSRKYLAHRLHVWHVALRKILMRRRMRRLLTRRG